MPQPDESTTVHELKAIVSSFVSDRDWERFHTPKNLASSICIEAAELLEVYQWDLSDCPPHGSSKAEEELADVLIYCLSLANALNIDVASAIKNKMRQNEKRYPATDFKGVFRKPERVK